MQEKKKKKQYFLPLETLLTPQCLQGGRVERFFTRDQDEVQEDLTAGCKEGEVTNHICAGCTLLKCDMSKKALFTSKTLLIGYFF